MRVEQPHLVWLLMRHEEILDGSVHTHTNTEPIRVYAREVTAMAAMELSNAQSGDLTYYTVTPINLV